MYKIYWKSQCAKWRNNILCKKCGMRTISDECVKFCSTSYNRDEPKTRRRHVFQTLRQSEMSSRTCWTRYFLWTCMEWTVWDGYEPVQNVIFTQSAHAQRAILFSRSKCTCAAGIWIFPFDARMCNSAFHVLSWILSFCVRHTWVENRTFRARPTKRVFAQYA